MTKPPDDLMKKWNGILKHTEAEEIGATMKATKKPKRRSLWRKKK